MTDHHDERRERRRRIFFAVGNKNPCFNDHGNLVNDTFCCIAFSIIVILLIGGGGTLPFGGTAVLPSPVEQHKNEDADVSSFSLVSQRQQKHFPLSMSKSMMTSTTISKLNANLYIDSKVLNIHVVPHTHDDVGWLKTVNQYYYGYNESIQHASVHEILDTSIQALLANPSRTFTYVEMKFFSMWWNHQSDAVKDSVRYLVANKQLGFVNGGWCMHDEASTHYIGMIDQTTLGHTFLKKELGYIPNIGWQLDPFGHSSTQASLLSSKVGFDALYFGRIDYQDLTKRKLERECEGLWNSTKNHNDSTVFWGLTGSYSGNYGPPNGFCFDIKCGDNRASLLELNETQMVTKLKEFLFDVRIQSDQTKGSHIMLTMGSDFRFRLAEMNFANIDVLISSVMNYQLWDKIDVSAILGPRFNSINMFYSSPEYYTECKYNEMENYSRKRDDATNNGSEMTTFNDVAREESASPIKMSIKTDDFFPYSDCEHCFWTGYFTSRTTLKRLERIASSFLLSTRQIESMVDSVGPTNEGYNDDDADKYNIASAFHELEDAVSVIQHHDGVSGTSKQHVAYDYAKRVQSGINSVASCTIRKLKRLFLASNATDYLKDLSYCQLLNETICDVAKDSTIDNATDLYVIVYNGIASSRSTIVYLPVSANTTYTVSRLDAAHDGAQLLHSISNRRAKSVRMRDGTTDFVLAFDTGPLPPVGAAVLQISMANSTNDGDGADDDSQILEIPPDTVESRVLHSGEGDDVEVTNGLISARFDRLTGSIKQMQSKNTTIDVKQVWGYYTSFDERFDSEHHDQNSGAYIFRPSIPEEKLHLIHPKQAKFVKSSVGTEIHIEFEEPWIQTTTRILNGVPYLEVEYTIGPISIADGRGKEVVTKFITPLQTSSTFFTDSNGREFIKRRRNYRPTWDLTVYEPVAGNYYPVNAAIYMEDAKASKSALTVIVDRSQGGASLEDGSLELMVQRRILADDWRGVDEALNETSVGITPEPPYANATRLGDGVVVTGTHRVLVGSDGGGHLARSAMDSAFVEPLIFVGSAPSGVQVPIRVGNISATTGILPPNVMLVTYASLDIGDDDSDVDAVFLVRLGHQYGIGEDSTLSKPVDVDLSKILSGYKILSVKEKTLSGNQDHASWEERRLDWTGQGTRRYQASLTGSTVTLNPMDILTFEIAVKVNK